MVEIKDPKLRDLVNMIALKTGKSEDKLLEEYSAILELAKENKNLNDAEKAIYARESFKSKYKTQLRSPAVAMEGVELGASGLIDMVRGKRTTALQLYQANKDKAIAEGYVIIGEKGEPIPMERDPNSRDFGKPLPENSWFKQVITVVSYGGNPPKVAKLSLNNELARTDMVKYHGKKIAFRANVAQKQQSEIVLRINQSTVTEFNEITSNEIPDVATVLKSGILAPFRVNKLSDLEKWHNDHGAQREMFVVVTGRVSEISHEPNPATKNYMMVLDSVLDDDLPLDHPGITVWIPDTHKSLLDFDSPSIVTVVGTTSQTEWNDRLSTMINAMGIYVDPKWKTDKNPASAVRQLE